jgi:hypothetical protein
VTSSFSWLDLRDEDVQRVREALAGFDNQGMVDPLGFGTVRDAFSDMLFPGVSTVQTRARYFLLVPWLFKQLDIEGTRPSDGAARARELELDLIETLLRGSTEREGIIGREARQSTQQLPSFIYWGGLARWGIRQFEGTRQDYFRTLGRRPRALRTQSEDEVDPIRGPWHGDLPRTPDNLFAATSLDLNSDEADFLTGRILNSVPDSYLAMLVRDGTADQAADSPWEHPLAATVTPKMRGILHHARLFSSAAHGAGLLYNAEMSRLLESDGGSGLLDDFDTEYGDWLDQMAGMRSELLAWNRDEFWLIVASQNPRVPSRARYFVDWWLDLVVDSALLIARDPSIVKELRTREAQLKGARAKLANRRARERSPSSQGADQMFFRWPTARRIILDIHEGTDRAESA